MGYASEQNEYRPKPKQPKQWQNMTDAEKKAWVCYFKGQGPRPGGSSKGGAIKWDE